MLRVGTLCLAFRMALLSITMLNVFILSFVMLNVMAT
jgi:hypothetical protein